MIYRPMYVNRIMRYTDTPFVKILTGIRRCGKSTILLMIMDNLRERGIRAEKPPVPKWKNLPFFGRSAGY